MRLILQTGGSLRRHPEEAMAGEQKEKTIPVNHHHRAGLDNLGCRPSLFSWHIGRQQLNRDIIRCRGPL